MNCSIWRVVMPQNETVVLAGDVSGHVGSSNVGYDGHFVVLGMEI